LAQVILAGNAPQKVVGVPEGVPVVDYSGGDRDEWAIHGAAAKDESDEGPYPYLRLAKRLRDLTNLEITTFQGARDIRPEAPIVIGPASASWRDEMALGRVRRLYLDATRETRQQQWQVFKGLRFDALYVPPSNPRRPRAPEPVFYGAHTILGPVEGELRELRLRGEASTVAVDPRGPALYYGSLSALDLTTGRSIGITSPVGQEAGRDPPAHPCLAFDTKRNRLLVIPTTNPAFLYAYDYSYETDDEKWTILRAIELGDRGFGGRRPFPSSSGLQAMCYSTSDDATYGIAQERDAGWSLYKLNSDGEAVAEKELSVPVTNRGGFSRSEAHIQLVAADDYLVIIVPPPARPRSEGPLPSKVYLIDPQTAEILYAGDQLEPMSIEEQDQMLAESAAITGEGHLAQSPPDAPRPPDTTSVVSHTAEPVLYPENGHFYEFISGNQGVTWERAKEIAAARTYRGMRGHLATFTSEEEETFVRGHFPVRFEAWIGATDADEEGVWKWATGPEAGTVFWRGGSNGTGVGYHNWVVEPEQSSGPFAAAFIERQTREADYAVTARHPQPGGRQHREPDRSWDAWRRVDATFTAIAMVVEYSVPTDNDQD
jgi:hypothetical protein